jgi:signal peptidase II
LPAEPPTEAAPSAEASGGGGGAPFAQVQEGGGLPRDSGDDARQSAAGVTAGAQPDAEPILESALAVGSQPAVDSPAALPDAPSQASDQSTASGPGEGQAETSVLARPSFIFFGVVSAISLVLDVGSKAWAEIVLGRRTLVDPAIVLIEEHLSLTLAYNKGGAWGLLQSAGDSVRKPFFLLVSVLAIAFIVSLYGRLAPGQRALRWGLPLVLGGALGNLSDRIVRSSVIDFIDYRADWVQSMNELVNQHLSRTWTVTDHWPTFNVADISICIGVGLMAVDMLTSRRGASQPATVVGSTESGAGTLAEPGPEVMAAAGDSAPPRVGMDRAAVEALARAEGEETPTVPLPDVMPKLAQDVAHSIGQPTPTAQLPDVMPRVAQDLAAAGQIPPGRGEPTENGPTAETPTAELPEVTPKGAADADPSGESAQ